MFFSKYKKKIIFASLILGLASTASATSTNDFVVNKIFINGLQSINAKTIQNRIKYKAGSYITESDTDKIINNLYKTGYFNNVSVYKKGSDLIIDVKERPIIANFKFIGNKKIKKKDLQTVFNDEGVYSGNIYNPEKLFLIKQSLLSQYSMMGLYDTRIKEDIKKLPNNRVSIIFQIKEGKPAVINGINVVGNKKISTQDLKDAIAFKKPSIWNGWGWFSQYTNYSEQGMTKSEQDLSNYYLNRGYLDFKITSKQVSITKDKEHTYINFDVDEGHIYKISNITLTGDYVLPEDEIKALIKIKKGQVFSKEKIIQSVKAIKDILGNKGYAFAQVNPIPEIDKKNHTVNLKFVVISGKKVYVNKITFNGNSITNDYVLRRQLQYYEQGPYNKSSIDKSQIRLNQLSYLKSAKLKLVPVKGTTDMVNLNYDIQEKNANSITGSVGYSDLYKFMIGAKLTMPNVLGTGNIFSINTQISKPYQNLSISYTNPSFTVSGISQTVSAFVNRSNFSETDSVVGYRLDSYGFNLLYGMPLSTFSNLTWGFQFTNNRVKQADSTDTSSILNNFIASQDGKSDFNEPALTLGWNYNSTNKFMFPTEGMSLNLNGIFNVPGSDIQSYKLKASGSYHIPIPNNDLASFSIRGGIDYGDGYGKTKELPFYSNFYAGGWGSVRGFLQGSLGPRDKVCSVNDPTKCSEGNAIGGNLNIYNNYDILFPVPFIKDSSNLRMGAFFDLGNTYNTYDLTDSIDSTTKNYKHPTLSNLKYSMGVELRWASPIGPVAVSLAKPFNVKEGDVTQTFQFSLGRNF